MRRAPEAAPRIRPELRPRKLTRRSASPSGKVFRMIASVSLAGMCESARRRYAERFAKTLSETHAHAELLFLPYANRPRNPRRTNHRNFCRQPHSAKSIFAPNSLLHSTHSWGLSLQQLGRTPFRSQSDVCLLARKTQNNRRLCRLFGLPDSVN